MKALKFFMAILFPLILMGCSSEGVFRNQSIARYDNGQIRKGQLVKDSVIKGYPCTSWVHFYENGNLKQFELASDYTVAGIKFPAATVVFLDTNGGLTQVYLPEDMEIQGYQCSGGNMKKATGFYPSGKLRFFFPHEDVVIDGIPCMGGSTKGIWLYESGKVKKAYLSVDKDINGTKYKKGDLIEL